MDNASKILKCSNCNIVICEVLAFVQNKLDVMDEESLIQICESAFNLEEIETAKSLLFESVGKQPTVRKRKGKTLRNIEDIICLLKETDPDQVPIFVAKQLEKLPPVTFNHVDVTPLLKKILVLESSVQRFQSEYVTKKELNNQLTEYCKCSSDLHASLNNINVRRGGGAKYFDSGPMAISNYIEECPSRSRKECNASSHSNSRSPASVTSVCAELHPASTSALAQTSERAKETTIDREMVCAGTDKDEQQGRAAMTRTSELQCSPVYYDINNMNQRAIDSKDGKIASFSDVVRKEGEWKDTERDEGWILYQKRRLRNRFTSQRGCAIESESTSQKFRAADIKVPLFISNVAKEVSGQDIIDYVYNKTSEKVSLVKINMRRPKEYDAYKILVSKHKIEMFLDDKLWPSGITFRRFVNFYNKQKEVVNNKEQIEKVS